MPVGAPLEAAAGAVAPGAAVPPLVAAGPRPGMPVPAPGGPAAPPATATPAPAAPGFGPHPAPYPPSRRSSGVLGWLILVVVLLVAALAVVIGVVASGDDDADMDGFDTTTPPRISDPVQGLQAMHAAFPRLVPDLPAGDSAGNGIGFGGKVCYATRAGHPLVQHNEGQPLLGNWIAAWDCWAGDDEQPDYALLAYGSPADVYTVLARLPPNRKLVEHNSGSPYTNHRWNTSEDQPRTTYYVTTSFENDAERSHYLLFCSDDYWPSTPRGLSAAAFAEWWKSLPLR
ncbi:hypothetical protein [Nocardia wallacei]|uniref:hypothetical protein n=1 Tax=Nocardia wallacei TaxID=480035 RepID=UPI002457AB90|nr:hypothetical protein [Nocardia wallacei]